MNWVSNALMWLYYWQTLAAGILALGGAWWTVRHIRAQITQSRQVRADEIARRHRSARIALPLTLASISEMIAEIGDNTAAAREHFNADGSEKLGSILEHPPLPSHFQKVVMPQPTLEAFQSFVETLDSDHEIRHVHELLASLQILVSRYNSFDLNSAGVAATLDDLLVYTAKVKLLNDVIFEYARQPSARDFSLMYNASNEGVWDQIHATARGLVFRRDSPDFFFPAFAEIIERRKKADTSPWAHGE